MGQGVPRPRSTGERLGFCVLCAEIASDCVPPALRHQPVEVEAEVEWGGDRLCWPCAIGRAETILKVCREKVETDRWGRGPKGPEDRMGDMSRYLWAVQLARAFGVIPDAPYDPHIRAFHNVLDTMRWELGRHESVEAAPDGAGGAQRDDAASRPPAPTPKKGRRRRFPDREALARELAPAFAAASNGGKVAVTQEAVLGELSPPPSNHTLISALDDHDLVWDQLLGTWNRAGGLAGEVEAATAALVTHIRGEGPRAD